MLDFAIALAGFALIAMMALSGYVASHSPRTLVKVRVR